MNDQIGKSLGLEPLPTNILEGEVVIQKPKLVGRSSASEEERDYKYARDNFYNVIEKGTDALEQMLDVAKASEHPRAYEVVSTLMTTLVNANKDLVKMGDDKRKTENTSEKEDNKTVNNNLFVGSTTDLQQMLRDMKEND
jgi:hypothetical protein